MENKLTICTEIQPSDTDYAELLSYPDIYALFQNISVAQSRLFKYDASIMTPKGLFWVTVRSRIRIHRRPAVNEIVELSTWPEKPDRIRGRRNYTFEKDGKRIIEATSEWAIIDRNTNRLFMINSLYDDSFEFNQEKLLPEPFHRFTSDFSGDPFAEYKVKSIDIDFEGHMNNVAYIRALFGLFSRQEIEEMNLHDMEFQYKTPCFEGDTLYWYKEENENGFEICAKLKDNTIIFLAKLK